MKCSKCKNDFEERKIQSHHKHPKFMDNPKGIGLQINMCEKCHNILHKIIPAIIWRFVPEDKKQKCLEAVIKYTDSVTK